MFRANNGHRQHDLFGIINQLPPTRQQKLMSSAEYAFYRLIFCQINEQDFAMLYADTDSRPNTPVNVLVGAMILQHHHGWRGSDLLDRVNFDLLTRAALGLMTLEAEGFCETTYYNFQKRLAAYQAETGINLLERVFDHLTPSQINELKLKTSIQRSDSFLAASNIRAYSRLHLVIEVLRRLHRILSEADQARLADLFDPYLKQTAGQYLHRLKPDTYADELERLGQIYHQLHQALQADYGSSELFAIFERVYGEHFVVVDSRVEVMAPDAISSGSLQSPDDPEATYRHKGNQESRGQTIHFSETCHPDNPTQLITDVAVAANNTDDSAILHDRLETMFAKTPDLGELHTDGGYGSPENDRLMAARGVNHVQTAIKGCPAATPMAITSIAENVFQVACPYQTVTSKPTRIRFKAQFKLALCSQCPLAATCSTSVQKHHRVYYFTHQDYLRSKRHQARHLLPPERQTLRANVEATVWAFKARMVFGKLRTRGRFKAELFAFATALAINFKRVFRALVAQHRPKLTPNATCVMFSKIKSTLFSLFSQKLLQLAKHKFFFGPFITNFALIP